MFMLQDSPYNKWSYKTSTKVTAGSVDMVRTILRKSGLSKQSENECVFSSGYDHGKRTAREEHISQLKQNKV